jgi:hypothetical protein
MTDDMIREHLARAHLAESVTLDAGTWTEVLEELLGRRHNDNIPIAPYTLIRYDADSYWLAHESGEGMQVSHAKLQAAMNQLWQDF